jgi:glycosyltransferase involved in cell wall biosynthesis
MKVLFLHQAFPGQFRALAPALAARGDEVHALTTLAELPAPQPGVTVVRYRTDRTPTPGIHPWAAHFERQVIQGEACFQVGLQLKAAGFSPDVVIAHPGWGESLFIKSVWPAAKLGLYCEFYAASSGLDVGFDPEFSDADPANDCLVRLHNQVYDLHVGTADAGLSPTCWQASTFPPHLRPRIAVVHDGVDTERVAPDPDAGVELEDGLVLTRADEVVTFVSRNLEPLRGYHSFMRALPEILSSRPRAHILIAGGDGVSYGRPPEGQRSWRQRYADEVRPRIADRDWARVHFLGAVPYRSFLALLQVSSVHVYLTYPYILSWSLLEAMSAGCAVVASDTPPVREVLRHGETGFLTDFFDPGGLAQKVSALLADPDARASLGASAREAMRRRYDLHSVSLPAQIAWVDRLAGR